MTAIPANTVVAIRTIDLIDSSGAASDRDYRATVDDSVIVNGVTVAPVGTPAYLRVMQTEQAGAVRGRASVSLRLVGLDINGQRLAFDTGDATIQSTSQGSRATKAGIGGAVVGGLLGGLLGGRAGLVRGAAVGAAAGVTAAAVSGPKVHVPAETRLSFSVATPVDIPGRQGGSTERPDVISGAGGGGAVALYDQGVTLFNTGKNAEAKSLFEQAIASDPNYAEAHYMLGMLLVGEDATRARGELEQYLTLAPNGRNAGAARQFLVALPKP